MSITADANRGALGTLRQMMRSRALPTETCELCSAPIAHEHDHLLEPGSRKLMCACQACSILFSDQQHARFRRVPRKAELLTDFDMTDAQWDALLIPINLAFFFHSSPANRVIAIYPSPAGATESLLEFDTWQELAAANPRLSHLQPDVEALLVNRAASAREHYLVSIDRCYELVGLMRLHWKGLSGGNKVWEEIRNFFETLRQTAQKSGPHA
jgi:hypothetical protein